MIYKVTVDGNEIEYGALVEKSSFTEKEWAAIYTEVVRKKCPGVFKIKKNDEDYIHVLGSLISLEERYEALLDLLPQEQFSVAGAQPKWVAKAVEENTLDKETTKEDVTAFLEHCETLEDLREELKGYFSLEDLE